MERELIDILAEELYDSIFSEATHHPLTDQLGEYLDQKNYTKFFELGQRFSHRLGHWT